MANPAMYFNRDGDLVVSVDGVEAWLEHVATRAQNGDEYLYLQSIKELWANDINGMIVMAMELKSGG